MATASLVLGLIPARGGSKGVPRKNLRPLGGVPLVVRSIQTGLRCRSITDLCVSTDDEEIAAVCSEAGAKVPFLRPAELATDEAPTLPTMQHALAEMEKLTGKTYDYLVLLEPTSPFRIENDVEGALSALRDSDADSIVGVTQLASQHPIFTKKIEDGVLLPFVMPEPEGTRRQDAKPPAYCRNGAIYVFRTERTTRRGRLYGDKVLPWVMPDERSVNIDREVDFLVAESLIES